MDLLADYVRRMNIVVAVILEIAQIKIGVRTESVLLRRILKIAFSVMWSAQRDFYQK